MLSFGLPKQKQHGKKNDKCELQNGAFRTSKDKGSQRKTDTKPATAKWHWWDWWPLANLAFASPEHIICKNQLKQPIMLFVAFTSQNTQRDEQYEEESAWDSWPFVCIRVVHMQAEMLHVFQEWVENPSQAYSECEGHFWVGGTSSKISVTTGKTCHSIPWHLE